MCFFISFVRSFFLYLVRDFFRSLFMSGFLYFRCVLVDLFLCFSLVVFPQLFRDFFLYLCMSFSR